MDGNLQPSVSLRLSRRGERNYQNQKTKDAEETLVSSGSLPQDYPMKIVWKKGFVRLVLVAGILWMLLILTVLLFHVWSCQSSLSFFSAICNKESKVYIILDTMGLVPKPQHRCSIPVVSDPDSVIIPRRTPEKIVQNLSYILEDEPVYNKSRPLFGGHQSWIQREKSFKLNSTMKVHCGFMRKGGAEMNPVDVKYVKKCRFVVASGIFDGYDVPHQPSNMSRRSKRLFCFLMVVDEQSFDFIKKNVTVREDNAGGKWEGIWRLVLLRDPPYDEPRRNGKVPKIITHRLFPQAHYSIWIDGKMELMVDPLLILERYLWRGKHTFAIARHKHHQSIYEEADAIKRRKRYARPLVDLQMKIYRYEGMEPWSLKKGTVSVKVACVKDIILDQKEDWICAIPAEMYFNDSVFFFPIQFDDTNRRKVNADVPEGAIIIREHTALNNLFSCLWFNEVNLFTPRDQLSFGYVVYRLGDAFNFFMFPNCEYNSLFVLHPHTREHSSVIEWVKDLRELKGKGSQMKESRGGLGLWTPYPGDLGMVVLPPVARTSKAG